MEDYYELRMADAQTIRSALSVSQCQYGRDLRLLERMDSMMADARRSHRRVRIDYDTSSQILATLRECIGEAQVAEKIMLRECYGPTAHIS